MSELQKVLIVIATLGVLSALLSALIVGWMGFPRSRVIYTYKLHALWIGLIALLAVAPKSVAALLFVFISILLFRRELTKYKETSILFLICMLPNLEQRIPGVFGLDSLFVVSMPLLILLSLIQKEQCGAGGYQQKPGFAAVATYTYITMFLMTQMSADTVTEGLRWMVYYGAMFFLTINLAKNRTDDYLEFLILGILQVGVATAVFAVFESQRTWLLFTPIIDAYQSGAFSNISAYKFRGDSLRAYVVNGNLQSALFLSVAILCVWIWRSKFKSPTQSLFVMLFLAWGLYSTGSRGAAIVLAICFVGAYLFQRKIGFLKLIYIYAVPIYLLLDYLKIPGGLIDILGLGNDFNYIYRVRLYEESSRIIIANIFWPSDSFLTQLASAGLVQGEGIVDIVNTYLQVGLYFGGIALAAFLTMLYLAGRNILLNAASINNDKKQDAYAIFFVLTATLIQASSVSTVGFNAVFLFINLLAFYALYERKR